MNHNLHFDYEVVIDRLFSNDWGPFTDEERKNKFKEMYKKILDDSDKVYSERNKAWAELKSLEQERFNKQFSS